MSERVERRLLDLLDHPHVDPYGNPIPGLQELGEGIAPAPPQPEVRSLSDVVAELQPSGAASSAAGGADGDAHDIVLERIGEPLQVDVDLLARMAEAGLRPGQRLELRIRGGVDLVSLHAPGADVQLDVPEEITRHLFVTR
jgi:DtxR family Mn-dependent transcriptional regulator